MKIKMNEDRDRNNMFNLSSLSRFEDVLNEQIAIELRHNPATLKSMLRLSGQVDDNKDLRRIKRNTYDVQQEMHTEDDTGNKGRADIVVQSEDFILIIEIKLFSSLHKMGKGDRRIVNQLEGYKKIAEDFKKDFPDAEDYYILIYPGFHEQSGSLEDIASMHGYGTITLEDLFDDIETGGLDAAADVFKDYMKAYKETYGQREENENNKYKKEYLEYCLKFYCEKFNMNLRPYDNHYEIINKNINPNWSKFYIFPVRDLNLSSLDSIEKLSKKSVNVSVSDALICTMGPNRDRHFVLHIRSSGIDKIWLDKDSDKELTKMEMGAGVKDFIKAIYDEDIDIADRHEEASTQYYNKEKEKEKIRDTNARRNKKDEHIVVITKNGKPINNIPPTSNKSDCTKKLLQYILKEEGVEKMTKKLYDAVSKGILSSSFIRTYDDFCTMKPQASSPFCAALCYDDTIKYVRKNDLIQSDYSNEVAAVLWVNLPAAKHLSVQKTLIEIFSDLNLEVNIN